MASATIKYDIYDFWSAKKVLAGREMKKIGNNTWLIRRDSETIIVKYHSTAIAVFKLGYSCFYTGGWKTYTTKDRINQLLPYGWSVYQYKHQWFVRNYKTGEEFSWYEGVVFTT